jgi:serine/threonine-protein phosphatase 2B catalytic subunit
MELLPDPTGDREVKNCPLPPNRPLADNLLWPSAGINILYLKFIGKPDWRLLKDFMLKEGPIKKE